MRYYLGANTINVIIPDPPPPPAPNPDWPITLSSADPTGHAVLKVLALDPNAYTKPDTLFVVYIPGVQTLTDPQAVLNAQGAKTAEVPFPTSFGAVGLDQNIPVTVPGPFAPGPWTVYAVARVQDPISPPSGGGS